MCLPQQNNKRKSLKLLEIVLAGSGLALREGGQENKNPVENFDGERQEKGSGSASPSTISIDGQAAWGE
jgi:hypothetical protein